MNTNGPEPGDDICGLCENAPPEPGDVFCFPCRIEATALSVIVNDPVECLLSSHQRLHLPSDSVMCMCAESFDGPAYYRRHVAELIYAALGLDEPMPWTPAAYEVDL